MALVLRSCDFTYPYSQNFPKTALLSGLRTTVGPETRKTHVNNLPRKWFWEDPSLQPHGCMILEILTMFLGDKDAKRLLFNQSHRGEAALVLVRCRPREPTLQGANTRSLSCCRLFWRGYPTWAPPRVSRAWVAMEIKGKEQSWPSETASTSLKEAQSHSAEW